MNSKTVQFITPQKVLLNGLLFGPESARRMYIFVHGLGSNVYSGHELMTPLADAKSAVLFFNNRGHDVISRIKKRDKRKKSGTTSFPGGATHEIFTDSADDIQGAITFAAANGAKEIILVGHSTGCQKIVYYLARKRLAVSSQKLVVWGILLSPLSDYAAIVKETDPAILEKAVEYARKLTVNHEPHTLILETIWPFPIDAQRFLSLYTPNSEEEIFTYAQKKKPRTLQKVKIPMLILLGEKDEYRDRPMKHIARWFEKNLKKNSTEVIIIPNADHGFNGDEDKIAKQMKKFLR